MDCALALYPHPLKAAEDRATRAPYGLSNETRAVPLGMHLQHLGDCFRRPDRLLLHLAHAAEVRALIAPLPGSGDDGPDVRFAAPDSGRDLCALHPRRPHVQDPLSASVVNFTQAHSAASRTAGRPREDVIAPMSSRNLSASSSPCATW